MSANEEGADGEANKPDKADDAGNANGSRSHTSLESDAEAIFQDVLDAPAETRAALLEARCTAGTPLRARVEELLRHFDSATSGFLEESPVDRMLRGSEPQSGDLLAERYRLVRIIGQGGLAIVWQAEQIAPVQRVVAVKVLKPGMDSRQVLGRFELERETLARLHHPGIAVVLDAGATERGRPFVVMELVDGRPLSRYCDEERLSVEERLRLVIEICHAVEHAHGRGVIHRDLKPSNILAWSQDGKPTAKVIDFGIARAIESGATAHAFGRGGGAAAGTESEPTAATALGQVIGTPEYMSPEQASGDRSAIGTASDVYSLGVILYELLTGELPGEDSQGSRVPGGWRTPLGPGSPAAASPTPRLDPSRLGPVPDPPRPSTRLRGAFTARATAAFRRTDVETLRRTLRGELDWIVLKALEWLPERRYAGPRELADDLERALRGEAVVAGPPTTTYRLKRFILRNRGPVIAASLLVVAIAAGAAGTVWGLLDAREQRDAARRSEAFATQQTYRMALSAGMQALETGDHLAATASLVMAPESLRGWEWRVLRDRAASPQFRIQAHKGAAWTALFTPDGRSIISAGADGTIRKWPLDADGQPEGLDRELCRNEPGIWCLALAPDNDSLLCSTDQGEVFMRSIFENRQLWRHAHGAWTTGSPFSPDGRFIAAATIAPPHRIALLDAADGEVLASVPLPEGVRAYGLAFSPCGTQLWWSPFSGSTGGVIELATGDPTDETPKLEIRGHTSIAVDSTSALGVVDAARRRICAIGAGPDPIVVTWDGPQGSVPTATPSARLAVGDLAIKESTAVISVNPDGTGLAVGDETGGVWSWNFRSSSTVRLLRGTAPIHALRHSSDGRHLLATTADGTLHLWTDPELHRTAVAEPADSWPFRCAAVGPEGRRVATAGWGAMRLWDAATGMPLWICTATRHSFRAVAFSPDGERLVGITDHDECVVVRTVDGSIVEWSKELAGVKAAAFVAPGESSIGGHAESPAAAESILTPTAAADFAAATPGLSLILLQRDGTLRRIDAASGAALPTPKFTEANDSISLATTTATLLPAGPSAAVLVDRASPSPTVALVTVDSVQPLAIPRDPRLPAATVVAARAIGESDILLLLDDGHIFRFDPVGALVWTGFSLRGPVVADMAVTPEEDRIAVAAEGGSIALLEASTGTPITVMRVDASKIFALNFNRAGQLIGADLAAPVFAIGAAPRATAREAALVQRVAPTVRWLFEKLGTRDSVLRAIDAPGTQAPPVPFPLVPLDSDELREAAGRYARGLGDFANGLGSDAILTIRRRDAAPSEYERALELLRSAAAACPEREGFVALQAAALSRLNRHEEARETFARAMHLAREAQQADRTGTLKGPDSPMFLVLDALLASRRGERDHATRLAALLATLPEAREDLTMRMLLEEIAESLITGPPE